MSDYQQFELTPDGPTNIGNRMKQKMEALDLPNMSGMSVLDVGCDHGFWCYLAASQGAGPVLGLDRNREVRGEGLVDLITRNTEKAASIPGYERAVFRHMELGTQYHYHGAFDVLLMCSMYHHAYECAGGDHVPIWFWLWRHMMSGGLLVWEGPLGVDDPVAHKDISPEYHANYNRDAILEAASHYFTYRIVGPAVHEPTRHVVHLVPKLLGQILVKGEPYAGAGGATPAFEYADGRRMCEVEDALGVRPIPGSLNVRLKDPFPWDAHYFRVKVHDVVDRAKGLGSPWAERWLRLYPTQVDKQKCWAFRFEGESYPQNVVELISPDRLRDHIQDSVIVRRWVCVK